MPEAIKKYLEAKDVMQVLEIQHEILDAYEREMAKHTKFEKNPLFLFHNENFLSLKADF
jgi:hypothetical protein